MFFINTFLPIFSIALTLLVLVGGFVAFRQGFGQQSASIQAQTIEALKTRVETLEGQAEDDAKQLARLRQLISTIRHALKRRGLHIEIEGDFVSIIDSEGQARSTQIPSVSKVSRPVKLQPIDEDDAS